MTDTTYHLTEADVQKTELKNPNAANLSTLKSIVGRTDKGKQVDENKANLPLPEQPPTASDWSSADANRVNIGSGRIEGPLSGESDSAMRDPQTAVSSARESGEELHRATAPNDNVGIHARDLNAGDI